MNTGVEWVDALDDPRLADYRDLRDPERRRASGTFVCEGTVVVRRLLASRFHTRSLLLTRSVLDRLSDVLEPGSASPPVYVARAETIRGVVGFPFHRGCLAIGERPTDTAWETLIERAGPAFLVVVEELRSADNVGAVFRNAAAFGADGVLLSAGCCDPLYRKAIRVSAGGVFTTPFARAPLDADLLQRLRASGFTIVALTPDGAVDIAAAAVPERAAIVLGTEGDGLSAAARRAADVTVRIAVAPGVDSLNVGTACGIALHRLRGGRVQPGPPLCP